MWPTSRDDEGRAPAHTPGTDLRSGSTNPYDIELLASVLSEKSKEEGGKKPPRFNGYTGDLALQGGNLFTLKGGGNVELL